MPRTKDATKIIDHMVGKNRKLRAMIAAETVNVRVARMVYDARTKARLTQKQLADRVGTTQSVIARLEDADYRGHSLTMLNRVAAALDMEVDVRLVRGNRFRQRA